jgi:hypothetical protein
MSSMNLILDELTPAVEGAEMLRKIPPAHGRYSRRANQPKPECSLAETRTQRALPGRKTQSKIQT